MNLQQIKKKCVGKCSICDEANYTLLDCHRIEAGSKYTMWGTLTTCSNCHRRIHNKEINILGKYNSTAGVVIHYEENGKEYWKNE
jgi:hypothetical protein